MAPREIEEVEQTGDMDSVKATGKEIVTTSKEKTTPPLTFLSIFTDAKIPINTSDPSKLCKMLRKGVFLKSYAGVSLQSRKPLVPNYMKNFATKILFKLAIKSHIGDQVTIEQVQLGIGKYFVDKENKNCFKLFAGILSVIWGEDERYWGWSIEKDSDEDIEVAELKNVCYLDISGKIWTVDLSPGILYEVVFVIKIKKNSNISNFMLKLTVAPPDLSSVQPRYEKLKEKPLETWIEILVGEFKMSPQNVGNMTFRLEETSTRLWKSGLLVKCAIIRPKKQ